MEYTPKKKETKSTKAIYLKDDSIAGVEDIIQETGQSFSEIVNHMIDFCLENKVETEEEKPKKKNESK